MKRSHQHNASLKIQNTLPVQNILKNRRLPQSLAVAQLFTMTKLYVQIAELDERAARNISYDASRNFVGHVRQALRDIKN